ncbi:MAG: AAA family ATPase [Actinomycetota bacterium]
MVGAWVGITQAQLSRIENGPPIVHLDRLVHWARILRIPQEHLWFKLPEEAGWRQLDQVEEVGVPAVHNALLRAIPAAGEASEGPSLSALERRILDAWAARSRVANQAPLLVLIGGFAGSGKTEFGRFLTGITGWTHLDKDALTRPLVESLLSSLDADPNDRHTPIYNEQVRPVEYRCLLTAAFNNLDNRVSTVLTAPFLREMPDQSWLRSITRRCATLGVDVVLIWVDADIETMCTYLQSRDAARDTWKLNHWDSYLNSIDLSLRPRYPHFVVDNSQNAAVSLADQAQRLASLVHDGA